jgi:hypothetical protein
LPAHFENSQLLIRSGRGDRELVGIEEADRGCHSAEEERAVEKERALEICNLGAVGLLGGVTVQFDNLSVALLVGHGRC